MCIDVVLFFFKQKTAYEMRISDWSSDVCSSDVWRAVQFAAEKQKNTRIVMGSSLREAATVRPEMGIEWPWPGLTKITRGIRRGETYYLGAGVKMGKSVIVDELAKHLIEIGRASCRERVCQYVWISVVAV